MNEPTPFDEGVGSLLDQAEVMLSLAGEPTTTAERFMAAQTTAMIALTRALGYSSQTLPPPPPSSIPGRILAMGDRLGYDSYALRDTMQDVERQVPDWRTKKIQAIKVWRDMTGWDLRASKDMIDAVAQHPQWW